MRSRASRGEARRHLTASGVTGEFLGTGLTTTGIGSLLGVPTMVVSAGLVTSGAANMAVGLRGLSDALMSSGSGGGEQAAREAAKTIDPNKLNHIFGQPQHALDDFVRASGGREQAFTRIQNAANTALREGKIATEPNGILPSGNAGNIIDVGGTQIRLIGGRVVDGAVEIGSVSRMGLP